MSVTVNELTGEVNVALGDVAFTLHATLPNVASLMADLQISGLRQLHLLMGLADPRVTYSGMKCLCTSGNAAAVGGILFGKYGADAHEAVTAALVAGMPEAEEGEEPGKPPETDQAENKTTPSPGDA
ncbi:hypothetical protein [uncultured Cohaesibacter sp.]|uniref:hypothetical protein n=1 Tax=uncultured Cohaesibacter sp. TaxID=1002546 RepID=UPI0029C81898|nr:hypothetical protein [uncultured Cohaesibacter sp.]